MVETVRITLGDKRHAPVIEIARADDFKKAAIVKKLDTFVAREANESELKKTENDKDRLGIANRTLQKELQSKLLRLHQKLSAELSSQNSESGGVGLAAASWQKRTWKENCDEVASKAKAWSIEFHEIQARHNATKDQFEKLSKLGTRKIEKELTKIEKQIDNSKRLDKMRQNLQRSIEEHRKQAKKTTKVFEKIETTEKEKMTKLHQQIRQRIESEIGEVANNKCCCEIM